MEKETKVGGGNSQSKEEIKNKKLRTKIKYETLKLNKIQSKVIRIPMH